MDKWSVASIGERTDVVRRLRRQKELPKGGSNGKTTHISACTIEDHKPPQCNRRVAGGGVAPASLGSIRLTRALGILRRLAQQEEILDERSHLSDTTPSVGRKLPPLDAADTDVPSHAPSPGPSSSSVFRGVEAQWAACVREWEARAEAERATEEGQEVKTDSIGVVVVEEHRALEMAIDAGAVLNLSALPIRLVHLPAVVEFLTAAANAPPRIAAALPLRTVDLTSLETVEQVGNAARVEASRVVRHLCQLLENVPSIVVLHLSEHCALTETHCSELQARLTSNLAVLQRELHRRDRCRRRIVARSKRHDADELLNFFLWENTDRCAIMELDRTLRSDTRREMKHAAETTLRNAQLRFTQQRLAVERAEFYAHVCESAHDYYRQSLHGLIRAQLKFLQQQETRERGQIVGTMSTALDSLVTAHRVDLHRLSERQRNCESSRRDGVLALLREERGARARECGQVLAFQLVATMLLHHRCLRGVWANIIAARDALFLGPYMMPWALRPVDGCGSPPSNTCATSTLTVHVNSNEVVEELPNFNTPGECLTAGAASINGSSHLMNASHESGGGAGGGVYPTTFRAARSASAFLENSTRLGASAGGAPQDVSAVAQALLAAQRAGNAASPTNSIASKKSQPGSPSNSRASPRRHVPSPTTVADFVPQTPTGDIRTAAPPLAPLPPTTPLSGDIHSPTPKNDEELGEAGRSADSSPTTAVELSSRGGEADPQRAPSFRSTVLPIGAAAVTDVQQ